MIKINFFLISSVLLLLIIFNCDDIDGLVIETKLGSIKGVLKTIENLTGRKGAKMKNYYTFKKVPYAEPPTAERRFKVKFDYHYQIYQQKFK